MLSMPKLIAPLIVVAGLLALTGCQTSSDEMPYTTMDLAEPVNLLYKTIGGDPALKDPGLTLINSQAELDALGAKDLLGREVNFHNEQVILATLGEMPSAGYWINVTSVTQIGDALHVYGQANRPGPEEMTGQLLTYPYCAVIVPRTTATLVRDQIDSVQGLEPPM